MAILVVGSVAIDSVITPSGKNFNAPGGSATYFALSASYFTKVKLVAVVGRDFPKKYIHLLKNKGIDLKGLMIEDGRTFKWKGSYKEDLDNPKTIETHLNLFKDFRPTLPDEYRNEEVVFLANIDPQLQIDVLNQIRSPRLTAADTMCFWIKHKRKKVLEVLKRVDLFIINEHEAKAFAKEDNLLKAAKHIISYGPKCVVVKKGESGLLFISKDDLAVFPAYPIEHVCDPTGAGDTFAGGFLGYLSMGKRLNGRSFRQALLYGSIMASFNVEGFDIRGLSKLKRAQIKDRIRRFQRICMQG